VLLSQDIPITLTGGALALLLLREIFAFVKVLITKDRRQNNGAGDKSVEFWEQTQRRVMREEMAEHFKSLRESNHKTAESLQGLTWSMSLIVEWIKQQREDDRRRQ